MIRHSPSRNQRSKGIKVKHVLQICFLGAICLWLLYQVKHSHDKKKEFDDGDVKTSQLTQDGAEIVKLGRKDLNPKVEDGVTGTKNQEEEEAEDENAGEEEDAKIEEEIAEDKTKPEEKGEDIDEHAEEDKSDAEVDREEDVVDEDKEIVENDSEEKGNSQSGNENSTEEHDDDEQTHEAREEHYKADDASSAVTHETENGNATVSNNLGGTNIVADEQAVNTTGGDQTHDSRVEEREMIEETNLTKTVGNKETENSSESGSQSISANSTMEVSFDNSTSLSSLNVTEIQVENATTEGATPEVTNLGLNSGNTSLISSKNQTDSSLTTSTQVLDTVLKYGEASKTDNGTQSGTIPEHLVKSANETEEATYEDSAAEETKSSDEENAAEETRSNDEENAAEETRSSDGDNDASNNGSEEESEAEDSTGHDLIDASDSAIGGLEEKDVRTDLETLPEIQTEGSNDEDGAAAE